MRNIEDFFPSANQELSQYLPQFPIVFTDLVRTQDKEIEQLDNESLVATLLAQKYSKDATELIQQITRIFNTFTSATDRNYIEVLVVYILSLVDVDKSEIIEITQRINRPLKQVIMSTYDLFINEGIEKGIEQGIEKGIEKAKIDLVLRSIDSGLSVDIIANITDLSVAQVNSIIAQR